VGSGVRAAAGRACARGSGATLNVCICLTAALPQPPTPKRGPRVSDQLSKVLCESLLCAFTSPKSYSAWAPPRPCCLCGCRLFRGSALPSACHVSRRHKDRRSSVQAFLRGWQGWRPSQAPRGPLAASRTPRSISTISAHVARACAAALRSASALLPRAVTARPFFHCLQSNWVARAGPRVDTHCFTRGSLCVPLQPCPGALSNLTRKPVTSHADREADLFHPAVASACAGASNLAMQQGVRAFVGARRLAGWRRSCHHACANCTPNCLIHSSTLIHRPLRPPGQRCGSTHSWKIYACHNRERGEVGPPELQQFCIHWPGQTHCRWGLPQACELGQRRPVGAASSGSKHECKHFGITHALNQRKPWVHYGAARGLLSPASATAEGPPIAQHPQPCGVCLRNCMCACCGRQSSSSPKYPRLAWGTKPGRRGPGRPQATSREAQACGASQIRCPGGSRP
jgi:hypothetical protein